MLMDSAQVKPKLDQLAIEATEYAAMEARGEGVL